LFGEWILGGETALKETIGNPGAAHLIFFAKLSSRSGADQDDAGVVLSKMPDRRLVVAKASDICGLAITDFVHQA